MDGESIAGLDLDEVNARIAGPDGTPVTIGLRRFVGRARPFAHASRSSGRSVPPETVFASRAGGLLLIRVTGFAADTGDRIIRELRLGVAAPPAGDRARPARQPRRAAAAVGRCRGRGARATRSSPSRSGATRRPTTSSAPRGRTSTGGLPIVVLVDGRSASAAEIMAAALVDQRRAVAVGSATLGKGLVQTIAPLPDGGELFVTWSRVLAPLGWPLQGLGVLPQLCTSLGEETTARELADLAEGRLDMADALARHNAARAPLPAAAIVELRNACPAAEGRDSDMDAARFLLDHPAAYQAALLPEAAGPDGPALAASKP